MYMIFRCYYSNRQVVIDSEAPLHVCKATEPPAVKIREINLRSCRRESNPRRQRDERASNPLGHRGSSNSRVNILHDPKKIARKRFMAFFSTIRPAEENVKSWQKSDHRKWSKYSVK